MEEEKEKKKQTERAESWPTIANETQWVMKRKEKKKD